MPAGTAWKDGTATGCVAYPCAWNADAEDAAPGTGCHAFKTADECAQDAEKVTIGYMELPHLVANFFYLWMMNFFILTTRAALLVNEDGSIPPVVPVGTQSPL